MKILGRKKWIAAALIVCGLVTALFSGAEFVSQ
jgi:hypothetical protein